MENDRPVNGRHARSRREVTQMDGTVRIARPHDHTIGGRARVVAWAEPEREKDE
jgi:hypothetical protein